MENRRTKAQIAIDGDAADDKRQEIEDKRVKAELGQRQDSNVIQFTETRPHSPASDWETDEASSAGGSPDYLEEAFNDEMEPSSVRYL